MPESNPSVPSSDDTNIATNDVFRQRLLHADEVYIYKIPPLAGSGGHRAEDWNLAAPLATTQLLVERRGDTLVFEFITKETNKVFAVAIVDLSGGGDTGKTPHLPQRRMQHWLEPVVDSSRYFTLKISGQGGREATIGFGVRDRDVATDLREAVQHYERAMRREEEGATATTLQYSIPKLADGEKIHIKTNSSTGKSESSRPKKSPAGGKSGGVPLLLRKPPPSAAASPVNEEEEKSPNTAMEKLTINVDDVDLEKDAKNGTEQQQGQPDDDNSGAAVKDCDDVDDDDDWESSEFQSAS